MWRIVIFVIYYFFYSVTFSHLVGIHYQQAECEAEAEINDDDKDDNDDGSKSSGNNHLHNERASNKTPSVVEIRADHIAKVAVELLLDLS